MKLQGKQVLVTGAGGFIGSHLAEALVQAGARTRALIHYNSRGDRGCLDLTDPEVLRHMQLILGDIRDRSLLSKAVEGCDCVFHLAALIGIPYSYQAAESYVATNVLGTLNVLETCREHDVARVLCTSTSEVYGTAQFTPIDEKHPLHAQSPYAATKIGADQLALSYHAAFAMPIVVVRPFNTFGPRQSARAVIPTIIAQALAGETIRLGRTETVRDFLYVSDTADGFLAAAEAEETSGEVFNLATGRAVSIQDVVDAVGTLVGRSLQVQTDADRQRPATSEVFRLEGSAEKAARQLGWRPRVDLHDGLERTIAWIRTHRAHDRPGEYTI